MELEDTLEKIHKNWITKHKSVLSFLKTPGLQEHLIAHGAPKGIKLILAPGSRNTHTKTDQIPLVLKISTAVRYGEPWLRFRGGMLDVLRSCIRRPENVPLYMCSSAEDLMRVEEKEYIPKRYREAKSSTFDIIDNEPASPPKTSIRTWNKLGFNPEFLVKAKTSNGYSSVYKESIERFKIVLGYLLHAEAKK